MLSLYTAYDLQMDLKEFIKSARKKDKFSVQKMADLSACLTQRSENLRHLATFRCVNFSCFMRQSVT